ncbi:NAD(P)-binding protein [Mollisia scopiformis]|uniref:NAD(P)-binding protein n=1 Tax=Mollisia scopiformis TaxID=149040 RepID=A0A194XMX9_MOLSC|nr:NAD(P)-binding protein [Mollisia scopiformis]KUJ21620.1 NAD(P)-binding protein [Mollisia scopiformis]
MASINSETKSSIFITGGNGSLGSAIALQIARFRPKKYHLILTARKITDPRTINVSSTLKTLNASFEFQTLDLSSLDSIRSFAATIRERVSRNDIPRFSAGGMVLSAAMNTLLKDTKTKDGWNEIYGINVLAQILLIRELLPVLNGGLVINIASAAHAMAAANYFSNETKTEIGGEHAEENLGLGDAMKRYGASKLWVIMASHALQRRLDAKPNNAIKIVSLDPGGMSGDSNLGLDHWVLNSLKVVLGFVRPVLGRLKKDAFNPPEVPAKAVADLFEMERGGLGGKYFVLDDEVESSGASLEVKSQEEAWGKICRDLEIEREV